MQKLALGTAQFGFPYGIRNLCGQIPQSKALAILKAAGAAGMDTIDTAVSYGESERVLGKINVSQWKVITKLPLLPPQVSDPSAWAEALVKQSLTKTQKQDFYGVLLHHPMQLMEDNGDALYEGLVRLKTLGLTRKIGISVYTPRELEALFTCFDFDLVQVPFNVFDRRFSRTGWLVRLNDSGIEVHARSVFLQGLLLATPSDLPAGFSRWVILWERWHQWLKQTGQTPLQACLGFALAPKEIDRVIVGIDNPAQFQKILSSAGELSLLPPLDLCSNDLDLINPSCWRNR